MNNAIFDEYHFKIQQALPNVPGKKLFPAKVLDDRNRPCDWNDYESGKIRHTQPIQMRNNTWAMVYAGYDFNLTTNCFEMMQKA